MEDAEIEEGEAFCYKEATNIDPDIDLSYIDEKLHNVLGHFQKDFEGGVSAENLGAKFGGYGSFLPSYQRSPSIWSQPKTPQKVQNFSSSRSPNVLPVEGAPQDSTAPTDSGRSLTVGTTSCSLDLLHTARAPSGDVSAKQNACSSSAQVIENFPLKHEPVSYKPANPTDQRTLKVRIKVGSDKKARKNAAIYSGLGLISPSSSMGNSPEESGGMPSACQVSLDKSPNTILQIMTSFPIPSGIMLSPLHQSLHCLARMEKLSRNTNPVIKSGQEHSAALADDSASSVGNKKVPKGKSPKILEKSNTLVVSKQEIGMNFDENRTTSVRREVSVEAINMENETLGRKQGFSNDTKLKPLSYSVCHVGLDKAAVMAPEVPMEAERNKSVKKREVIKDGVGGRLSVSLVKEELLESISEQGGCTYEKAEARSSSLEKTCESRLTNSLTDISTDLREVGNKVSAPFKADTDGSNCKRDSNIVVMDHSRPKVNRTVTNHAQDQSGISRRLEGPKKSKQSQSNGKPVSEAEESFMAEVCEVPKEKKKTGKLHNSKSRNDSQKVRDNHEDVLCRTRAEQMNNQRDSLERPFGGRASKELSTRKKVNTELASESFPKEAANDELPSAEAEVTSETELTSVAPIVIEEDWVCCDRCQKWRLLPYGTKPDQLPEKWLCSILNWLPGMNRCDISEEETTKALHALYQFPLPDSQNHGSKTAAGVSSTDARHFDQNYLNLSSNGIPSQRKKKQGSKAAGYAVSNGGPIQIPCLTKNIRQHAGKRSCLNDMNEPFLESNLMSNSSVRNLSKSCNFPVDKSTHKHKEKHVNSGDSKQKKLKSNREVDQDGYGTTKKFKADVAFDADNNWATEHSENFDKAGRVSGSGLPSKAVLKSMEQQDEHCFSKDAKSDRKKEVQIPVKQQEEHASLSLHTGSVDMKTCDEREISLKKRKLKDWQESQNYVGVSRNKGNHLPESKVFVKEESSDNESRKAKKSRLSRTEGKESSTSKGDDILNRTNKVTRIHMSGNKDNSVHGREEVRSIENDQQPRKHKVKVSSKPASEGLDLLKRDLGSEQFSRAATSSSSKVSDSRKSRAHYPEVQGSPVESVSSSPMRTSNIGKISLARRDSLGKDAVRNSDFPVMDSPRRSLDAEGNLESNRSGAARRGKVSVVSHLDSLGFPVLDFQDNNAHQEFDGKFKTSVKSPSEFWNSHLLNSDINKLENPCPRDLHASDHCHTEDRMNKNRYHDNALFPEKSGKGSSVLSKGKDRSSSNNLERVKVKVSAPLSEIEVLNPKHILRDKVDTGSHDVPLLHNGLSDLNCRIKPIKDDKSVGTGKWGRDRRRENQFAERDGSDVKLDALCHKDGRVSRDTPQQNLTQDSEDQLAKRSDSAQAESRGGNSLVPAHAGKQEPSAHVHHSVPGLRKGNAFGVVPIDSSGSDGLSKAVKQPTNDINELGHPVPNRPACKDVPSPLKRDGSSHLASKVLKEAEDLRDTADRLKGSGFVFECNEAYFQAALKFLQGASFLETCNGDSSKRAEMSQIQIYSNAAKLCETCAQEYEKHKEMAAAALAYKCMEVAYMRVVYYKNSSTNRDRHDLQASLQLVPQGESPSSSASDVDNLNNQAMADKASLSKGIGAHGVNHVIVAQNRPNFVRLLDFTKDVNSAMEASRKSKKAFAAANIILEEAQNKEGITSVKRVIDFSFQDIEELIRLVRLAIEAFSCKGFTCSKD
ncbi:MORC family CW-type zinc finger protein [Actinidia chinensis var. chinensis]|uniref:MORC family CW-type zinc finger protein n=1 Tax=Actinidia chinensis var. chinensis TaxID=1590841 RepID=A0A2R6R0S0_ACTCC|nr:MORC family CW-type zinc finger protein [Actinidia chinensis var. chinensis]